MAANYEKGLYKQYEETVTLLEKVTAKMEEMEIISPVLSISVDYRSMVHFDDTVVIQTKLAKYNGIKMEVEYIF